MPTAPRTVVFAALCLVATGFVAAGAADDKSTSGAAGTPHKLFTEKGEPRGWSVRAWDDVSKPGPEGAKWVVDENGVLHGSEPRGTWLVSDKEYGDFTIEYDWKLGERGNSGFGVRFPPKGDPAFDGMEIQMNDVRYNNGADMPNQLTGSFYKAIAPKKQVYKPTQWNHYKMSFKGPHVKVELNGELIQDVNLDEQHATVKRHDNTDAPPLKDRPRRGHIGFQELSRGGAHVMIKNVVITEDDSSGAK